MSKLSQPPLPAQLSVPQASEETMMDMEDGTASRMEQAADIRENRSPVGPSANHAQGAVEAGDIIEGTLSEGQRFGNVGVQPLQVISQRGRGRLAGHLQHFRGQIDTQALVTFTGEVQAQPSRSAA
jgi:hypothetical protein